MVKKFFEGLKNIWKKWRGFIYKYSFKTYEKGLLQFYLFAVINNFTKLQEKFHVKKYLNQILTFFIKWCIIFVGREVM
jgi:hypothetical protein